MHSAHSKISVGMQLTAPDTREVVNYLKLPPPVKYEELQRESMSAANALGLAVCLCYVNACNCMLLFVSLGVRLQVILLPGIRICYHVLCLRSLERMAGSVAEAGAV